MMATVPSASITSENHPTMISPDKQSKDVMDQTGLIPGKRIRLPEQVEGNEVVALLSELRQIVGSGSSVSLIACDVKKLSTLALQVLVAAKTVSGKRNLILSIEDPSPEFARACADTGLTDILGVTGVMK